MNNKEAIILKTMNINEESMILGLSKLAVEDFQSLEGKLIFGKLKERLEGGKRPSLFLILNELNDKYKEDIVKAIDEIQSIDPDMFEFEELIKDLKNNQAKIYFKQKIEESLKELDKGQSIESVSSKITEYACQLANGTQYEINGSQLADKIMENARKQIEEKNKDLIKTSFETINRATGGGYRLGELHMIAAGSGVGKTTIGCNILRDIALTQNIPSLWINTEMIEEQMLKRWQIMLTPNPLINSKIINNRTLDESELKDIERATNIFRNKKEETYFQVDDQELTPDNVEFLIQKYIFKGVKFIIIDYIGNIEMQNTKDKQEYQILTAIAKKLSRMAKKYKVCILVLAQLTKDGDIQGAKAMKNPLDSLMFIEELSSKAIEELPNKMIDAKQLNAQDLNSYGFPFRHRLIFDKARNAKREGDVVLMIGCKSLFLDKAQTYTWLGKYGQIGKSIL